MKSLTAAMLAMAAFSGVTVAHAASTTVSGGTIHFTGEVVNAACAVAPESADQTVPLGQVRAASLADAGSTANPTGFNIKLNDCDTSVSTTAAISFYGPTTAAGDALSVSSITTAGAAATNVGIQILDQNSQVVSPNTDVPSSAFTLIDGTNTLPFTAQFISTDGGATAGAADADATFNVAYN
ncbi:type 1 fimbrial major subunit FimA [Klebsiella aerogenes]|uniref:type 1 fimbrial major subunit FimA n=1 Tax=Klebsiella aerogenes TaxID=548 RepID=UPI002A4E27F5|nr:type 1 fimbrial major subunit FimA [Klebsiella aerogenes]